MAELLMGKALFPGTDHIDQLKRIMELVGKPDQEFLQKISSESARIYVESLPKWQKEDFRGYFSGANPDAVDLLDKMLILDTDKRLTAEQALEHPYMRHYHNPTDEPTAAAYDDSFEKKELNIAEWRKLMYEEVEGPAAAWEGLGPEAMKQ